MRHGTGKQENVRLGPTARVWQRLAEPAWWGGVNRFGSANISLSTWTIVCAVRHGVEGVQCSEILFGRSRSLSSLRALECVVIAADTAIWDLLLDNQAWTIKHGQSNVDNQIMTNITRRLPRQQGHYAR